MGTLKISVLEQDGVDLDFEQEMDLLQAINYVGFTGSGFNENLILVDQNFDVLCDEKGNVLLGVL